MAMTTRCMLGGCRNRGRCRCRKRLLQRLWALQPAAIMRAMAQLRAAHGTRLVFGLTSPEMCDADLDATVRALNAQAQALMDASDVPTVDLHAAVVAACGAPRGTPLPRTQALEPLTLLARVHV